MFLAGASFTEQQSHIFSLEDLLNNINDALIATDEHFVITTWNKAAEYIYGIKARDAIGINRLQMFAYEYVDSSVNEVISKVKATGKWNGIAKFTKSDGSDVYLQSSSSVIKSAEGITTGYVSLQRDITKEYLDEQSLQNFTAILHFLDESFLIVNRNWKVVFLSPKKNVQAFHQSDYKIGDPALLYIPYPQQEEVTANYLKAFAGENISHLAESEGDAETKFYLHITYMPVKNNYGNVTHVAVIIKDLTEAKRAAAIEQKSKEAEKQLQQKLLQSRVMFESFMENCPLPSWITDEEGLMRYMNPTYLKDLYFTKEDIGKSIFELFPKTVADGFYRNNLYTIASNQAASVVENSVAPDGSDITYLITKFPLYYEGKNVVGGWAIDITEQIRIQQQLEESNQFKDKIFALIGHDLRSPVSVISALASLAMEDKDELSKDDLVEYISTISVSANKVTTLLNELLVWAQNKISKQKYHPEKVEIADCIHSFTNFFQDKLQEKNIRFTMQIPDGIIAYADVDMLKTVLRNLIANAIKFSPDNCAINIAAEVVANQVCISVSDEGCGVSDELKSKLLNGTNNVSTFGTRGEKGIGIGLGICRDFIEMNKGVMMIKDNKPQGTVFIFTIPQFL